MNANLEPVMIQYASRGLVITPWSHGLQLYDKNLDVEYFLDTEDLRVLEIAIQNHFAVLAREGPEKGKTAGTG